MNCYSGKSVFPGIAFGKVYILTKAIPGLDESPCVSADEEIGAFRSALEAADRELEELYNKTLGETGEEEALVIDLQRNILQDGDFHDVVINFIRDESSRAPWAVSRAGKQFSQLFESLDDPYMNARSADILDAADRIVSILLGIRQTVTLEEPSIILAEDLSPSQTLQLDKKLVRAFVTQKGSSTSHTAILARSLAIPAIVQSEIVLDDSMHGKEAAVDAHEGKIFLEPDGETRSRLEARQKEDAKSKTELRAYRDLSTETKDGKKIELYANIGGVDELEEVLENGAEGIGLFRSEFLYLGRNELPSEDEQFEAYRRAAEVMAGRRVVIRTLDIGADKQAAYLGLETEENPALGCRAIRLCFSRPEILVTQLRALYRASAYGNIAVMFPMVASLWELKKLKEISAKVREDLENEGKKTGAPELGIMIETPAAALIADDLAREADFFSVGTNDLTQYTLAVDRQNERLIEYADSHHPAVLKLLEMTAASAKKAGIWAGICGELAADQELTGLFISMGYSELSVSPAFILSMRKNIRETDLPIFTGANK
ncbi:phosphoenolpyruvate--protein phosphotransferase [Breznakiella homolactica]|uniref:Phosphoenolpyruvate-protein phosphotransferase n=1 Tax=Breznakiella homolactica TaxID=2798577 RepID=A0A7T7XLD9_9SPIR|nr:phosphoenolpyruvate--protein phosphotransferase [Breznakiella homolactica]QQO08535.1 phosphoenolpyruvate--protein phosphotransferase [Breznakiella homolactica]